MLTDTEYNAMLDNRLPSGAGQLYLSAHTDYSATGANMVSGSRSSANFSAAASRQKALSAAVDLTIGAGNTVKWIGVWDSTQTSFKGMYPNGGTDFTFQLDTTANERIYAEGHGLVNNDKVVFHNGTAPTGLTAGTTYWVVGVTAGDPDYFQVSLTQGGAPINITGAAAASCVCSKIVEETYAGAGTHRVNTMTISL